MDSNEELDLIKEFWDSGILKIERYELNGVQHGIQRRWCEDGSLLSECTFVHGKLHGVARLFTETGLAYIDENFENGVRHGEYISRWDSGGLKEHGFYIHGEPQPGYKYYREDGTLRRQV